jgi:tRNA-dihydrouridine synthase
MRRHYTNYFKGYPGIKDFRQKLVTVDEHAELENVMDEIAKHYGGMVI